MSSTGANQETKSNMRRSARQGKVAVLLLGLLTVLSVVVAGVAITLQRREQDLRLAKERELVVVKSQNEDLEQQLRDVRTAKQQIEGELAKIKDQLAKAAQELETERQAKEILAKSVDERQREIDRLGKDLEQNRSERTSLSEQLAQLKKEQETLHTQLAELEKAKADLESKALEFSSAHPTVELDKVVVTGTGAQAASSSAAGDQAAAVQGQVVVVNREYDFIVMNLGKNHGLAIGQEFQIVRGDQVLGRVKVEKVYDELSAAAILPESKKDEIREGDTVKAI